MKIHIDGKDFSGTGTDNVIEALSGDFRAVAMVLENKDAMQMNKVQDDKYVAVLVTENTSIKKSAVNTLSRNLVRSIVTGCAKGDRSWETGIEWNEEKFGWPKIISNILFGIVAMAAAIYLIYSLFIKGNV